MAAESSCSCGSRSAELPRLLGVQVVDLPERLLVRRLEPGVIAEQLLPSSQRLGLAIVKRREVTESGLGICANLRGAR
jgi:hypothetical protein